MRGSSSAGLSQKQGAAVVTLTIMIINMVTVPVVVTDCQTVPVVVTGCQLTLAFAFTSVGWLGLIGIELNWSQNV